MCEPPHEKTCLRGLRPSPTHTGLYNNRRGLEACYFGFRIFSKKYHFFGQKISKNCVWFFFLYAFIISKVIIRTQNFTNASLISAPVVISYQSV